MSERGTCWSITINNPKDEDLNVQMKGGWKLTGQMEKGEEGTEHYQGMLITPQERFSAVKKVFPRAHIELAKNRKALEKYVHKDESRIRTVDDISSNIPTLFDYQHQIANKWNDDEFHAVCNEVTDEEMTKLGIGEIALRYVDKLVAEDIENGVNGIEYIAINPMWRSAWKKFWRSMVKRERTAKKESNQIIYDAEIQQESIQEETNVQETSCV